MEDDAEDITDLEEDFADEAFDGLDLNGPNPNGGDEPGGGEPVEGGEAADGGADRAPPDARQEARADTIDI